MVVLFDRSTLSANVFETLFATAEQAAAARALVDALKQNNCEFTRQEMSAFANELHAGKGNVKYNRRQFYERILTPMKGMGLVEYVELQKCYRITAKFSDDLLRIAQQWKEITRS